MGMGTGLGRGKKRGFTPSRFAWPKGAVVDTHSASVYASREDKERAKTASEKIGKPFVFNATLNLIARGESTDTKSILAEAKEIARASEAFRLAQAEKWDDRKEAA
jgi:hypothetical protein